MGAGDSPALRTDCSAPTEVVVATVLPSFARLGPFDFAQGRLAGRPSPHELHRLRLFFWFFGVVYYIYYAASD